MAPLTVQYPVTLAYRKRTLPWTHEPRKRFVYADLVVYSRSYECTKLVICRASYAPRIRALTFLIRKVWLVLYEARNVVRGS